MENINNMFNNKSNFYYYNSNNNFSKPSQNNTFSDSIKNMQVSHSQYRESSTGKFCMEYKIYLPYFINNLGLEIIGTQCTDGTTTDDLIIEFIFDENNKIYEFKTDPKKIKFNKDKLEEIFTDNKIEKKQQISFIKTIYKLLCKFS